MSQVVAVIFAVHRILNASLVACAAALAVLCGPLRSQAQEELRVTIPHVEVVERIPADSAPVSISPGYWIVSSHASPQDFESSAPVFCPLVTRFDQCGGFRQSSMQELMESIFPGVPVGVFCHGSFVSWEDVLVESRKTWQWLNQACSDQPVQMIYFSWPSDRPVLTPIIQLDVCRLGRRAGRNGFYMASLIQQLPSESPICLMGHSHGTRVIASALHLIGGGAVEDYSLRPGPCQHHRLRVVFAASAMDHHWLNPTERYSCALNPVECLLNLRNSCDPALAIYPFRRPFSKGALGFTGLTRRDKKQLGCISEKVQTLDLTEEIGVGHYWPNYFQRSWLAKAIRSYLFFS